MFPQGTKALSTLGIKDIVESSEAAEVLSASATIEVTATAF